ncbi:MAG: hypothetical protein J5878_05580 [Oscillospiraceae bacterium]|nr:hypothetical protein [Oscillospiraceae bacterium]
MKKTLVLFLMILWDCCWLFSACAALFSDDLIHSDASFSTIKKRFDANYDLITEAVPNGQYEKVSALKWVREMREHEKCMEFNCSSYGMGNHSSYAGFFYSPADDPLAMWRHDIAGSYSVTADNFSRTEDGWEYQESIWVAGGDDFFIVQQLAPYYYYYHLHY